MATSFDAEVISLAITRATNKLEYKQLRPKQELAVKSFLAGSNVFVCLPTGSGKSLCYCLLSKVFDFLCNATAETSCIVLIVSPLIALMQDQVRAMTSAKSMQCTAEKRTIN